MKGLFTATLAYLASFSVASPIAIASNTQSTEVTAREAGLISDVAPKVNNILTVTGPNAQKLLIELSPEVAALLSGLGLPAVGVPVGSIVASASNVGQLLHDAGPPVAGLLTVVGADGGLLLIALDPPVAGLVSGLGLPAVGVPVGTVLATVGENISKRQSGSIVGDLAPQVQGLLTVIGPDAKKLLIQLSPSVTALVSGLGLPGVGVPVGQVVRTAGNVGDLVTDLAPSVKNVLTVTSKDGGALLIELSPEVAALVSGLGLPAVGVPVGAVVATLGDNL